jgi:LacI family gluconate utilization system Gnt-I transcriptional repressor
VPSVFKRAPTALVDGRAGLAEILAIDRKVDSVFCSSDLLALGVLIEAQSRGIKVPSDLAVIGFGDLSFAAALEPPLTTVRIDGNAIGRLAARHILDRAEGVPVPDRVVDIGFSIVRRMSA